MEELLSFDDRYDLPVRNYRIRTSHISLTEKGINVMRVAEICYDDKKRV